jgi:hypothetical protein
VSKIILLGPQDEQPTLAKTLATLSHIGPKDPVALITAGREDSESEDDDIAAQISQPLRNLSLFARSQTVFRDDPELFAALRLRHDHLRQLQALYRGRLDHAMDGAMAVLQTSGHSKDEWLVLERMGQRSADLVKEVFEEAMAAVCELDKQHLQRLTELHVEFAEEWQPRKRLAVVAAREDISKDLAPCKALLIAGGHVVVLLNRLRLFGLPELLEEQGEDMPVIAWSAGAMALTAQVVAFHDSPPQGRGHAEVLESGLDLAPNVVALPHAKQRLLLNDEVRVSMLARRMTPQLCLALDGGSQASWDSSSWTASPGTQQLSIDGTVSDWSTP